MCLVIPKFLPSNIVILVRNNGFDSPKEGHKLNIQDQSRLGGPRIPEFILTDSTEFILN